MRPIVLIVALAAAGSALSSLATAGESKLRLRPVEIVQMTSGGAPAGTSGAPGIRTTILSGDPTKPGLYTIRVFVPPHTTIQAHSHRDERSAVVVSGQWSIGYGDKPDRKALKVLPPGSFYTEPAGAAHFARTGGKAAVVFITGWGPTDTVYVAAASDPRAPLKPADANGGR